MNHKYRKPRKYRSACFCKAYKKFGNNKIEGYSNSKTYKLFKQTMLLPEMTMLKNLQ